MTGSLAHPDKGGERIRDEDMARIGGTSSRRPTARPALGGFRSACVTTHAGDTRRRCWSGRKRGVSLQPGQAAAKAAPDDWRVALLFRDWRGVLVRRMPAYDPRRGNLGRASRERRGLRSDCAPRCRARRVPAGRRSPISMICGRMLRTRSARIVRREWPAGYTAARTSTVMSLSPAWR